jgi:hypothetical protein
VTSTKKTASDPRTIPGIGVAAQDAREPIRIDAAQRTRTPQRARSRAEREEQDSARNRPQSLPLGRLRPGEGSLAPSAPFPLHLRDRRSRRQRRGSSAGRRGYAAPTGQALTHA